MKIRTRSLSLVVVKLVLVLGLGGLLGGCIEFEEQTLVYHYDQNADELRILQVYHGIFGGDGGETLSEQEGNQLQSVLDRERTFFFANWIFEYDEKSLREASLLPDQEKTAQPSAEEVAVREAYQEFANFAIESVTVKNGGFFHDESGRLSGWQTVRIENASKVFAQANQLWNQIVISDDLRTRFLGVNPDEDAPARHLLFKQAAASDHQWIGLDGNRMWVRIPGYPDDFLVGKQAHADRLRTALSEAGAVDEADLRSVLTLLENPLWVAYVDGMVEMRCGFKAMKPVRLSVRCYDGYQDNAAEFAKAHGGIADVPPDLDALIESFILEGE